MIYRRIDSHACDAISAPPNEPEPTLPGMYVKRRGVPGASGGWRIENLMLPLQDLGPQLLKSIWEMIIE